MNLSDFVIPPWVKPAACALALAAAFVAGFQVESWRWSASELHTVKTQIKQVDHQAAKIHTESTTYEQHRQGAEVADQGREQQIRTIYRDVPVPADCAAPDGVRSVLDAGVAAANARTRGESGTAVPAAAEPAHAAG